MYLSSMFLAAALAFPAAITGAVSSTVHEWGTFTMVIDSDGKQLDWYLPLLTEPLPAFVYQRGVGKISAEFSVRMETPVIYFHTEQPYVARVHVAFGKDTGGRLTEWFPAATLEDGLTWPRVEVDPAERGPFPIELGGDHYYAARATSAAPVRVATEQGIEREKFLFYRGLANFSLPIRVAQEQARVRLTNEGDQIYSRAFLFERRGEHAVMLDLGEMRPGAVTEIDRSQLEFSSRVSLGALEEALVANGLFRDEASAMIETWRDSWFEEGVRVLFTVPRAKIDELLPLSIEPTPASVERAMIGRYELVTPELHDAILAFGERADRGLASDVEIGEVRQRFERVGYAVLLRSAHLLTEVHSARAQRRLESAWRFAELTMEHNSHRLGQPATDVR